MALTLLDPPAGTGAKAARCLARMIDDGGLLTRGPLCGVVSQGLCLAAPHPVFHLGLDAVRDGGAFESAAMTGWRYLVVEGDEVVATLELSASRPDDAPRFARVGAGRTGPSVVRALRVAERSRALHARPFALGMLRVPSVHAQALWLRDATGEAQHDRFVPLAPAPAGLAEGRLLGPERWMSQLLRVKQAWGRALV